MTTAHRQAGSRHLNAIKCSPSLPPDVGQINDARSARCARPPRSHAGQGLIISAAGLRKHLVMVMASPRHFPRTAAFLAAAHIMAEHAKSSWKPLDKRPPAGLISPSRTHIP